MEQPSVDKSQPRNTQSDIAAIQFFDKIIKGQNYFFGVPPSGGIKSNIIIKADCMPFRLSSSALTIADNKIPLKSGTPKISRTINKSIIEK